MPLDLWTSMVIKITYVVLNTVHHYFWFIWRKEVSSELHSVLVSEAAQCPHQLLFFPPVVIGCGEMHNGGGSWTLAILYMLRLSRLGRKQHSQARRHRQEECIIHLLCKRKQWGKRVESNPQWQVINLCCALSGCLGFANVPASISLLLTCDCARGGEWSKQQAWGRAGGRRPGQTSQIHLG